MLSAIEKIGELVVNKGISSQKNIEGKILIINLNKDNTSFKEITIEDFDISKIEKYLYKEGASKGNNPAPIAQITEVEKTFNKKLRNWLCNCENILGLEENDLHFVRKINQTLDTNRVKIIDALVEKLNTLNVPKKVKKFVTIRLDDGNKFLGDYEVFRKAVEFFENQKTKKASADENICSVCGKKREKVSGKAGIFKFYTIDKPGFIAGGFKESQAWKNFPICATCIDMLRKGKSFIESRLTFKFYGLNYIVIPRILTDDVDTLEEIVNIFSDTSQVISLKNRVKKRITQDENEILEYLASKKDVLTLNFLFLQKQQSAERILLLIEDVLPSRIKTIFEAKEFVDGVFNEDFNFGRIRTFFSKSDADKKTYDLDKCFLEIVDAVFKGQKLNFTFLSKFFIQTIRKEFVNDAYYLPRIKDAMMCMSFFEKLGLIDF